MRVPNRKPGKFSQIAPDPILTQEKFRELKNNLERLKQFSQPKAAAEVSRLAELGDFSENTEYQMAKGKLRGINNKILLLEHQLKEAQIIVPTHSDTVAIGSRVTVLIKNVEKTYQILGSSETDPTKGIISYRSPIGAALLGHKIGDEVEIKLDNKIVHYKIIKIE